MVVGWSRNARLYRHRQSFNGRFPSTRHCKDGIDGFRAKAHIEDVVLLPVAGRRAYEMRRGAHGWSGQTSWWYADATDAPDATEFIAVVKAAMYEGHIPGLRAPTGKGHDQARGRSGAAPSEPYWRYLSKYEAKAHPRHHKLHVAFKRFLRRRHVDIGFPRCHRDDLRYAVPGEPPVMVEIKPANAADLRFAIRTAMGQLLDYGENQMWVGRQLILVGTEVENADDRRLALSNGFAWPDGEDGFTLHWPETT